ncbi:hypothetical protein GCM10011339_20150 [Echinicola rosea]|uniref:Uncharacterized protein n=1 Tax=Echinicola rosea TaxID=1807691 RepID=A0ABQ1V200_9BACT|nr:hypothetical protein GCM10011339_20150 [Echinicola rosea]
MSCNIYSFVGNKYVAVMCRHCQENNNDYNAVNILNYVIHTQIIKYQTFVKDKMAVKNR